MCEWLRLKHFSFLPLGILLLLAGCSQTPNRVIDPLIETIYQAHGQQQIDPEYLNKQILKAQVIYLGETHDNPRHHELQAEILHMLTQHKRLPAIGFEVFSIEQTPYLLNYIQTPSAPQVGPKAVSALNRLRQQLGWKEDDQQWVFYSSLLKIAKQYQLPVFGADLAPGITRRLTRVGLQGLSALESELLYPSGFKNPDYRQLMHQKFTQSHCGWSQPELLAKLYDTWIARNDAMAMAISVSLKDRSAQPVVMILGSGHVSNNMAVYERVAHLIPDVRQLNLGFVPVALTPRPVTEYLQPLTINDVTFPPEHEYIWFTQRVTYIDPCERFKTLLKKHPG